MAASNTPVQDGIRDVELHAQEGEWALLAGIAARDRPDPDESEYAAAAHWKANALVAARIPDGVDAEVA